MIAQDSSQKTAQRAGATRKPLLIKPKRVVFYTIFILAFLLSGLIVMADVVPYRMNAISLLVIPLLLLYGIRIDRVVIAFALLTLAILLSAAINQVSAAQLLLFLRSVLFAFLIYSLVRMFVNSNNISTIIRFCVLIGMVQLPIMLLQFVAYDYLPGSITEGMSLIRVDVGFGTFHFKGDAAMTFFLILLVIFLLFERERNYIIKHRWFVILWFTVTVLVSNAELMKLAIVIVWLAYAVRYLSPKTILYAGAGFVVVIGILVLSGALDNTIDRFTYSLSSNLSTSDEKTESFLSGGYGRGAAIAYYLNSDLRLIGDGPSQYYDVITRERTRGNTGHVFTYYSEIGLIGLFLSYLLLFLIMFPVGNGRIRVSLSAALMFFSIVLLSVTTVVLANISIMLIYCLMALSYLVPTEQGPAKLEPANLAVDSP